MTTKSEPTWELAPTKISLRSPQDYYSTDLIACQGEIVERIWNDDYYQTAANIIPAAELHKTL